MRSRGCPSPDGRGLSRSRAASASHRAALWRGPDAPTRALGTHLIAGGEAVLCAARVEPHVEPGQIWVTEEFRAQLAERPSLWRTTPVTSPDGADEINVKKAGGTEPDLWVRLHRLEF